MAEEKFEARAIQKHLRRSPRKVRLVVDAVRGDRVDKVLKKLEFTNKGAADEVAKVVKSAAANIRDKFQEARLDNQEIYIKEIFVDEGATLKRIQPRAMGRANQIRKRTSHITVVVGNKEELVNQ
ncbi:50S ribosomal protein L22 [Fodinibius sp. Rm-B-1B1-1]|uniref:50S ribosomal protein L22 n=1 Tax=Fodinibius alkaliphilus TaxID=3140241 RepID=UPI003159DB5A